MQTEAKRTIVKQWQKEWKESKRGRLYKYVKKISDQREAQLELPRHEFGNDLQITNSIYNSLLNEHLGLFQKKSENGKNLKDATQH